MTIPLQIGSINELKSSPTNKGDLEEIIVDSNFWRGKPLPSSVAPTFESCAISRTYDLVVKVSIGYGANPAKKV